MKRCSLARRRCNQTCASSSTSKITNKPVYRVFVSVSEYGFHLCHKIDGQFILRVLFPLIS
ncbi:hypothetical protein Plhal703r1_c20g0089761 [Plasmopara halstedii]